MLNRGFITLLSKISINRNSNTQQIPFNHMWINSTNKLVNEVNEFFRNKTELQRISYYDFPLKNGNFFF